LVGIEPLANRLVRELASANGATDEALLTLADFLIVLREVDYEPSSGSLPREDFDEVFRPFLRALSVNLQNTVAGYRDRVSDDLWGFWERVVRRSRA
jgi:hypothetical protein